MASLESTSSANSASSSAWTSLVNRSITAWGVSGLPTVPLATGFLRSYSSLDNFLSSPRHLLMFWIFQLRSAFLSQTRMTKWDRNNLDDYILIPAFNGFVTRTECFFLSHFWQTSEDPDPDGKYLRLVQQDLKQQSWSYIWVDWSCIPQHPRTEAESTYFLRALQTMPGIIRNCGFMWFYPPFEPRLWILYEIAEYSLTCVGGVEKTDDIMVFLNHIEEMVQVGVRVVLEKYGYKCSYDRDKAFLTSWLEVLVLLKNLNVGVDDVRRILDALTWYPSLQVMHMNTIQGSIQFCRYEGTLVLNGVCHTFTAFPKWEDGKYSIASMLEHE